MPFARSLLVRRSDLVIYSAACCPPHPPPPGRRLWPLPAVNERCPSGAADRSRCSYVDESTATAGLRRRRIGHGPGLKRTGLFLLTGSFLLGSAFTARGNHHLADFDIRDQRLVHKPPRTGVLGGHGGEIGKVLAPAPAFAARIGACQGVKPHRAEVETAHAAGSLVGFHNLNIYSIMSHIITRKECFTAVKRRRHRGFSPTRPGQNPA
jgi:hypothetical protein